jgi:hypothetical protein
VPADYQASSTQLAPAGPSVAESAELSAVESAGLTAALAASAELVHQLAELAKTLKLFAHETAD